MRSALLLLVTSFTVHAAPAITVFASDDTRSVEGPPPKTLSQGVTQHALSPDGRWVFSMEVAGLVVRSLEGGAPVTLAAPGARFAVTPDSKFVVTFDTAFTRHPLASKDGKATLARGLTLLPNAPFIVSNTQLAFVAAEGSLQVADLVEGTARPLSVEPPEDRRCLTGNAVPSAISDDQNWLLFQHGCGFDVIRTDGSKTRELGFSSALLVGTLVIGDLGPTRDGEATQLKVMELNTGAKWFIEGVRLHARTVRIPGTENVLMLDDKGRVLFVELRPKRVKVLRDVTPRAVTLEPTSQGRALVVAHDFAEQVDLVLELDPATGQQRRLAKVNGAEQCFAHPTKTGAIVFAWRLGGREQSVLAEVDSKGKVRQRGGALSSIGNLEARGGAWALMTRSRALLMP
ncbi:MAG: hypothetical protein ABTQ32_36265 [Myxococcaceae bacterium]